MKAARYPSLFLVRLYGRIHGLQVALNLACRRNVTGHHLGLALQECLKKGRLSSRGEVYFQPEGYNLGMETRLIDHSHLNSGNQSYQDIAFTYWPDVTVRFWPDDRISEDQRNNTWLAQVETHKGITIGEVRAGVVREKRRLVREQHQYGDPRLNKLCPQWAKEGTVEELPLSLSWSGSEPEFWNGEKTSLLEDQLLEPDETRILGALFKPPVGDEDNAGRTKLSFASGPGFPTRPPPRLSRQRIKGLGLKSNIVINGEERHGDRSTTRPADLPQNTPRARSPIPDDIPPLQEDSPIRAPPTRERTPERNATRKRTNTSRISSPWKEPNPSTPIFSHSRTKVVSPSLRGG